MAIVNKRRRNQSVDELKTLLKSYLPNQEEPTTLRIAAYKPGPGSELRKMLAWFARPSDTCKCETRAETMNDWGVEGCAYHRLIASIPRGSGAPDGHSG
jgi:hypothetical protein